MNCLYGYSSSFLKTLMASDLSSGFSHLFTDTQSTTEKVAEKNKWTNSDLGQLQAQEAGKSM